MKLIVGLGNPGDKYKDTRHNIGFNVIDLLIEDLGVKLNKEKFNGIYFKNKEYIIAKPMTFMNLSGDFVGSIAKFFKIKNEDILVIYDEMDFVPGKGIMKPTGSAGGQNGMKDVLRKMQTNDIARIKLGIGRGDDSVDHVLTKFNPEQKKLNKAVMKKAVEASKIFIEKDVKFAMNFFNTKK